MKFIQRIHRIVQLSGYVFWTILVVFFTFKLFLFYHGTKSYPELPVYFEYNVKPLKDVSTRRGILPDGTTMMAWSLSYPAQEQLQQILSNRMIYENRIWFKGPFDEPPEQAFDRLTQGYQFNEIKLYVDQVLESEEYYYSYHRVSRYVADGKVDGCAMWLLSPSAKLLVYLNTDS
jgi:hypothetical protein